MCGITGLVAWNQDISADVIDRMTATLAPRGPDGAGTWIGRNVAIGHRRLAVIDIAGGVQPMEHNGVVLTFSGEVYNYQDLQRELISRGHVFRTVSDTEVVLHAFVEWGPACVDRFRGMFAYAVWDSTTETLHLARDHIGIKPLFYAEIPGGFVFGSEIKALLAHPQVHPRVNAAGVNELFAMPPMSSPGVTPFAQIRRMLPGTTMRVDRAGVKTTTWWRLESRPHTDDADTTVARVRELLEDTVAHHLMADRPLCSLLSGGVDSSAIAAIAAHQLGDTPLHTFDVDYIGDVEYSSSSFHVGRDSPFAHMVADHIKSVHTTRLVTTDELLSADTVSAMDLPSLSPINASLLRLFRTVSDTAVVALSGEAADELFGGYAWWFDPDSFDTDTFPWARTYRHLIGLLRPEIAADIHPMRYLDDRYYAALDGVPRLVGETGHARRMREVSYLTDTFYRSFLLDRKDRLSMAAGVEVRVPFCDRALTEYAWNIPWAMKTMGGTEKGVLRQAVADYLPAEVTWRRKSGYPTAQTIQYRAVQRQRLRTILADPFSPLHQLIDVGAVTALLHQDGGDWTALNHMSYLIETDTWMRTYRVELG